MGLNAGVAGCSFSGGVPLTDRAVVRALVAGLVSIVAVPADERAVVFTGVLWKIKVVLVGTVVPALSASVVIANAV